MVRYEEHLTLVAGEGAGVVCYWGQTLNRLVKVDKGH